MIQETNESMNDSFVDKSALITSYPYRWILLFAFCLVMATTSILSLGFSPIASTISVLYDCDILIVEMQTWIFFLVYIPANFFAIYINKNKGLRYSLILGSIFTALGGVLRILVILTSKFETAIVGSILAALG